MIRELSTYVYDDRATENGMRLPKDSDNHLCDALRYAFEDVKFFHPNKEQSPWEAYSSGITKSDFNGGWDI